MKHGKMTRKQAIEIAGIKAVKAVEAVNCQPTSRLQCDEDNDIEYSACVVLDNGSVLTAYYYMDRDWYESLDEDEDAEELCDWEIHGYEID